MASVDVLPSRCNHRTVDSRLLLLVVALVACAGPGTGTSGDDKGQLPDTSECGGDATSDADADLDVDADTDTDIDSDTDTDASADTGDMAEGGGDTGTCPEDLDPPGTGPCPEACTDGCIGHVCRISCDWEWACSDTTLSCPDGWPCEVFCGHAGETCQGLTVVGGARGSVELSCAGGDACSGAVVDCPDGGPCTVACSGDRACGGLALGCSDLGDCSLSCTGSIACDGGATMSCGADACQASCAGSYTPDVLCGSSCSCLDGC